jgi:hypothetical protein
VVRICSGNVVRIVERCSSEGKVTLLDGDRLDGVDILIIISFDSQRTGQQPNESEVAAVRKFLEDPGHTLFVCPHHDIGDAAGVPASEVLATQEAEYRRSALAALEGLCFTIWVFRCPIGLAFDRRKSRTDRRLLSGLIPKQIDLISFRESRLSISTRICRTSRCTGTALIKWTFWWNS